MRPRWVDRRRVFRALAGAVFGALACVLAAAGAPAMAAQTVRVGVLQFGTVNWELDALKTAGFDRAENVAVEVVPFAGDDATGIALQGGAVDVIVSDWLWVSRQRAGRGAGASDLVFVPYSTAVGAVMVPAGSPLKTLADLKGKRLGVAGGPLDKSWLLIQGLAKREGFDVAAANEIVYGAPPLLTEKARQGELDAVLNYWHFCARLEAAGFRRLLGVEEATTALGAGGPVAQLGYVFSEKWAAENKDAVTGFLRAASKTKALLAASDAEWRRLAPVIKAEGPALNALRDRYREGIPRRPLAEEEADARRLYRVLAELGGAALVGPSPELSPGTFWAGAPDGP